MLLPRFTLRTGLICLTASAFVSIALREAWLGKPWGVGFVVGLMSLALLLAVFALFFGLSWFLSAGRGRSDVSARVEESA